MNSPPIRPVLVGYLYQRPGTLPATVELLREYIQDFADHCGYELDGVFVGIEGQPHRLTISDLVQHLSDRRASSVLVAGPAYDALQALRSLSGITVLTFADAQKLRQQARLG